MNETCRESNAGCEGSRNLRPGVEYFHSSANFAPVPADIPFFQVALNLPHAGRVALRIAHHLPPAVKNGGGATERARAIADELVALLSPYFELGENPPRDAAFQARDQAAVLGRTLVDQIEQGRLGHDRLGQCVRNLFECLELGREGAIISLRAGEDPKSFQRPI